jgi:hypothetical protein
MDGYQCSHFGLDGTFKRLVYMDTVFEAWNQSN